MIVTIMTDEAKRFSFGGSCFGESDLWLHDHVMEIGTARKGKMIRWKIEFLGR
jgi:hypothetical protein